jgi:hypothetical protein
VTFSSQMPSINEKSQIQSLLSDYKTDTNNDVSITNPVAPFSPRSVIESLPPTRQQQLAHSSQLMLSSPTITLPSFNPVELQSFPSINFAHPIRSDSMTSSTFPSVKSIVSVSSDALDLDPEALKSVDSLAFVLEDNRDPSETGATARHHDKIKELADNSIFVVKIV